MLAQTGPQLRAHLQPVFADLNDADEMDWRIAQEIIAACLRVNGIDAKVETASGN